jgi:cytochrome c peroxidase
MANYVRAMLALVVVALLGPEGVRLVAAETSAPSQLDALKSQNRRAPVQPISNRPLVDLGRDLFFETALSGSGKTA